MESGSATAEPAPSPRIDSSRSLRVADELREEETTNDANAAPLRSSIPKIVEVNEEELQRMELQKRRRLSKVLLNEIQEEQERRRRSKYHFNYSRSDYPVREWKFSLPFGIENPVLINPLVTGIAVVCLWGLVLGAVVEPTKARIALVEWRTWVASTFAWFYQGTTALLCFFVVFVLYRFGHIHLGLPNATGRHDPPEFSTLSYICMVFTSGVTSAFMGSSLSQTILSQDGHFYAQAGNRSQDEIDLFALNLTVMQWGFAGWAKYVVVAVNMALAIHCFQLPMTLRSTLYPILRHYTWGWIGDCIDGLAIVASLIGVAVGLALGAMQTVTGLQFMGWVDGNASEQHVLSIQQAVIWVLTILFSSSVLTGVHGGVRVISRVAMFVNVLFMFLVFALDDSKYLLNLIVQEAGYYLQHSMLELNFWTDAFGQLREGSGRAVDGKASDQGWMDEWIVFYAAWWVTWAPFVGVFVGTISKGRKLWEVVVYTGLVPTLYCLVFFSVIGGVGLRQSRQALELQQLGVRHFNSSGHFVSTNSELCFDVPQDNVVIDNATVFRNYLPGITPVCLFDRSKTEFATYNVFTAFRFPESFQGDGLGAFLALLFLVAGTLHSIRSCDTVSLVVDNLASSGRKNSHWVRRVGWAVTLGALASALLSTGESKALQAVEAATVLCGFPFTVALCFMIPSVLSMCHAAELPNRGDVQYSFPAEEEFNMPLYGGVLNAFEYIASMGRVNPARVQLGMDRPSRRHVEEFFKGLVIPFVSLYQILTATYPANPVSNTLLTALYMGCYVGWIGFMFSSGSQPHLVGIGWMMFMVAGTVLSHVRSSFQAMHKIRSNGVANVLSACFMWPQVLAQLRIQLD